MSDSPDCPDAPTYRDHLDLYTEPLNVLTYEGAVVILGPGSVAVAMTRDAATRTADLLKAAVATAIDDAAADEPT
jgi:hypothetical protein